MGIKSGIYEIRNTTNGNRYVGSAVNLKRRWSDHKKRLLGGTHRNEHLQRAWNKYGEDAFEFDVLEYWEPEFLISMEQWWMNMLQPEYNIAPVAGNSLGYTHTDEALANMSAARMGNTYALGYKQTAATCAKNAASSMGNTNCLGYRHTDEARANMSAAHKGKPWSPARRAAHEAKKITRARGPE